MCGRDLVPVELAVAAAGLLARGARMRRVAGMLLQSAHVQLALLQLDLADRPDESVHGRLRLLDGNAWLKPPDHVQPQTATIYAPETPRQLIVDRKLKADANGDVEILDVFWNLQPTALIQDVVPPVLAYADLMATTDGRNHEAAKMIYERFIGPAFTNQA